MSIKITSNNQLRFYTVRIYKGFALVEKYKTKRLTPQEFQKHSKLTKQQWNDRINELIKVK